MKRKSKNGWKKLKKYGKGAGKAIVSGYKEGKRGYGILKKDIQSEKKSRKKVKRRIDKFLDAPAPEGWNPF